MPIDRAHLLALQESYVADIARERAVRALPLLLQQYMPGLALFRRRPCPAQTGRGALGICGEPTTHIDPRNRAWCAVHAPEDAAWAVPEGWTGPMTCVVKSNGEEP